MGTSGFKEDLTRPTDVWRSATEMSGAQCVMISGALLMFRWRADSWDSLALVHNTLYRESFDHEHCFKALLILNTSMYCAKQAFLKI